MNQSLQNLSIAPRLFRLDLQRGGVDHAYYHNFSSCGKLGAGGDGQIFHGPILQVELDFPAARAVGRDAEVDVAVLADGALDPHGAIGPQFLQAAHHPVHGRHGGGAGGQGHQEHGRRRGAGRLGSQAAEAEKRQRRHDRAKRKDAEQVHRAVMSGLIASIGRMIAAVGGMVAVEIAARVAVKITARVAVKIAAEIVAHVLRHVHVEHVAAKPDQSQENWMTNTVPPMAAQTMNTEVIPSTPKSQGTNKAIHNEPSATKSQCSPPTWQDVSVNVDKLLQSVGATVVLSPRGVSATATPTSTMRYSLREPISRHLRRFGSARLGTLGSERYTGHTAAESFRPSVTESALARSKNRGTTRRERPMEAQGGVDRRQWVLEAVDQYEIRLLRFAARLLGDEDAARDAVQQAFLQLCGQSPQRLHGRVGPWLFAVCRHYAIDVLRKREAASPGREVEAADCCAVSLDPAEAAEQADLYRTINRLVDQLPLAQREALSLWSEGFSYQQIAEVTCTSEGNVRVIVHRALKRLRQHVIVQKLIECQKNNAVIAGG